MIFMPYPLSTLHLDKEELEIDKKTCKKIGPCGVGKKALYLRALTQENKQKSSKINAFKGRGQTGQLKN